MNFPGDWVPRSRKIAKIVKTVGVVVNVYSLLKAIFGLTILTSGIFFLVTKGFPLPIGIAIILMAVAFLGAQILIVRRVASVDLTPQNFLTGEIKLEPDEEVSGFLAGIMRTGWKSGGYEFFGAGKVITPENALLLTNKRILFVTVPLPGADKMVAGTNIPMWQWLLAKKEISSKLPEMIAALSLHRSLPAHPGNFSLSFNELKKIKVGSSFATLTFVTSSNQKYTYGIRGKEDLEKARVLFKPYL